MRENLNIEKFIDHDNVEKMSSYHEHFYIHIKVVNIVHVYN